MPQVEVDGLTINYDVQGEGEPLLLIPYTSADHACWAFQLPAYTEHFSCIAIDLPGSGESDKPAGPYSTEGLADQVAAFLGAFGARDLVCSTRFAEPLNSGIDGSELVVFDHLSHAGLHEDPETFNRATLDFLLRQRS